MRVADYIAEWLKGINDCVFMVTGGYSMHLNDAIGRCGIKYVCTHHEQAAAIAAEGYARASGKPGLCMVTGGPGVTNALTGLFGSYTDSIPMIFVSGQVRTKDMIGDTKLRQLGDQEVCTERLVQPLVKEVFSANGSYVKNWLQAAELLATSGRPGPIWLEVPLDIQESECLGEDANLVISSKWTAPDIQPIINAIWAAERPAVIVGSGIRLGGAVEELRTFTEATEIPVLTAFHALDAIWPRQAGPFGTIGTRAANTILKEADLLLILGCRMNRRQIGYELGAVGKNAYKIMVDIDPEELDKPTFKPDLGIVGQVKSILAQLNECPLRMSDGVWASRCSELIRRDDQEMPLLPDRPDYVNPYRIIQKLNDYLKIGDQVVSTNAMASIVAGQMLRLPEKGRFMVNSGAGPMGYGLPMAIGAALAKPDVRTICLEGDGSIMMNLQELQTVKHYKIPLKILLFNNQGYGSIRTTQDAYFNGFHVGADKKSGVSFPDYRGIADAFDISFVRAYDNCDLAWVFQRIFENKDEPIICEFNVDPDAKPMPKGL